MEETIRKEIRHWDTRQVSIFINSNIPNCKKVIKETRDLIKTEIKEFTINILKAQNKELEERNNQLRMTILGVNINTGMIKGNELIIEKNNEIINNL